MRSSKQRDFELFADICERMVSSYTARWLGSAGSYD